MFATSLQATACYLNPQWVFLFLGATVLVHQQGGLVARMSQFARLSV